MISAKSALKIATEQNRVKREEIIDKLNEDDAKHMLKIIFCAIHEQELDDPGNQKDK